MAAKKRRERQVAVRLREDEYAALQAEAEECEIAIADVIRRELGRVVRKWRRAGVVTARTPGEMEGQAGDERPR